MLKFNVIGIDLAKNVLQICVISKSGELVSNKIFGRQKLKEVLAKSSPSIVGIEGCGSSHYWGRLDMVKLVLLTITKLQLMMKKIVE